VLLPLSRYNFQATWNPILQSIFESAVDGIIVIDARGIIKPSIPPAFRGLLHDLSRRGEIEDALRQSEERLRSIVELAVDAIVVIDDRGQMFARGSAGPVGWRVMLPSL